MASNANKLTRNNVFRPDGELTIYTAEKNKEALVQAISSCEKLTVDLSKVSQLDTAGIQILLLAYVESKRRGIDIKFKGHSQQITEVLELCRLSQLTGDASAKKAKKSGSAES